MWVRCSNKDTIKPLRDGLVAGACLRLYQHSPTRLKCPGECNLDGAPVNIFFSKFDFLSNEVFLTKPHLVFKINKWILLILQRKKSRWRWSERLQCFQSACFPRLSWNPFQHRYNFTRSDVNSPTVQAAVFSIRACMIMGSRARA